MFCHVFYQGFCPRLVIFWSLDSIAEAAVG